MEIDPSALAISARDHDRIIDNILKFSPNTETPRIVYYNFGGEALQHIRMAYAGELATEYVLAGLCERIPGIPVGGTIDATSQTMVSIERAGGISNRSGFSFVDRTLYGGPDANGGAVARSGFSFVDRELEGAGDMPGGAVARSGFSFVDRALEGAGDMPGGTVSADALDVDIDCYWGDAVTIPAGYTVESVRTSKLYLNKSSTYLSMGDSRFYAYKVNNPAPNVLSAYNTDYIALGASPCLQIFLITDTSQDVYYGYYLTYQNGFDTTGKVVPVSFASKKLYDGDCLFDITATYSNTTDPFYVANGAGSYACRIGLYNANSVQEQFCFDFPSAYWQYQNGSFTWINDTNYNNLLWYYTSHGNTQIRIHCVKA